MSTIKLVANENAYYERESHVQVEWLVCFIRAIKVRILPAFMARFVFLMIIIGKQFSEL